jgi:hypothetical protein
MPCGFFYSKLFIEMTNYLFCLLIGRPLEIALYYNTVGEMYAD